MRSYGEREEKGTAKCWAEEPTVQNLLGADSGGSGPLDVSKPTCHAGRGGASVKLNACYCVHASALLNVTVQTVDKVYLPIVAVL